MMLSDATSNRSKKEEVNLLGSFPARYGNDDLSARREEYSVGGVDLSEYVEKTDMYTGPLDQFLGSTNLEDRVRRRQLRHKSSLHRTFILTCISCL